MTIDEQANGANEVLLSISDAAELLGVAPSALRYYESKGLIKPHRVQWSNYRGYSSDELFELTDVVRFRNADLAVKDLPRLFSSPIVETLDLLDTEIDRKLDELEEIRLSLSAATHLANKIRRRMTLGATGVRRDVAPGFAKLARFDPLDKDMMADYLLRRDELRYVALFESADEPEVFVDCAGDERSVEQGEVVWTAPKGVRYVEFLLTTDYGHTERNDLAMWRDSLAGEGIRIGSVVAEYLTYDVDPETGRRFDCYDAWAQVV